MTGWLHGVGGWGGIQKRGVGSKKAKLEAESDK